MEQVNNREPATKLLIDDLSNFRFHVAYLAYSEAWDENPSDEARTHMNGLLSALTSPDPNYEEFYSLLGQFRKQRSEFHQRVRIQSQRKSDYRRTEKKTSRNSRYR